MDEEKQVTEVREGDGVRRQVITREARPAGSVVAQRVVYFIGGVIIAIIALRFLFQLLGASEGSAFVDFIYSLSAMFVWPFDGIFGEPTYGFSHFDSAALVAIVIYGLVTIGIAKLFALGGREA
jgi:hypothetical protein